MINREDAVKYFPEFVKLVEKEMKQANKRAKQTLDGTPMPLTVQKEYVKPRDKNKLPYWYHAGPKVEQVATLALEGKTKSEIAEITGLKFNTVANYITMAKAKGVFPKEIRVRDR